MRAVISKLGFLTVFVGAKALALIGMLWLARVADPTLYGAVEAALAVGLMAAGVGLMGIPGGATRLALAMEKPDIADLLSFAALCLSVSATLAAVAALFAGAPPAVILVLASIAPACFQVVATTFARVRARPLINSVVDPFAILATLALCAGLWLAGVLTLPMVATATTLLSVGVVLVLVGVFLRKRAPGFASKYMRALKVSAPLLALSGVGIIVSSASRPVMGAMFSLENLAVYALCFRLAAPIMLVHQVIGTAFFAKIYQARDAAFDKLAAALLAVWMLMGMGGLLVLQPVLRLGFPQYADQMPLLAPLFLVVELQVILWIVNALMEMRVGRSGVAGRAAIIGYVVFAALAAVLVVWRPSSLGMAALAFDVSLAAFALGQVSLLWRTGDRLPLTAAMTGLTTVVLLGIALNMGLQPG